MGGANGLAQAGIAKKKRARETTKASRARLSGQSPTEGWFVKYQSTDRTHEDADG